MTDADPDVDRWERVGRELAARECARRRADADDELYALERTLREGDDVEPADIEDARRALNALRRLVEDQLAPLAGVEPWGSSVPSMPYSVVRENYHIGENNEEALTVGDE